MSDENNNDSSFHFPESDEKQFLEKMERLENGEWNDKNILSFFGFAPVDDPQVACLVMLDEPDIYNAYGSTIAAPIVGSILADVPLKS